MKRPSDDDGRGGYSSDSRAQEIAQKILKKYSRAILFGGICLVVLVAVALIVAHLAAAKQ